MAGSISTRNKGAKLRMYYQKSDGEGGGGARKSMCVEKNRVDT